MCFFLCRVLPCQCLALLTQPGPPNGFGVADVLSQIFLSFQKASMKRPTRDIALTIGRRLVSWCLVGGLYIFTEASFGMLKTHRSSQQVSRELEVNPRRKKNSRSKPNAKPQVTPTNPRWITRKSVPRGPGKGRRFFYRRPVTASLCLFLRPDSHATHACTLQPAALVFVSYGFVLVRVRVCSY